MHRCRFLILVTVVTGSCSEYNLSEEKGSEPSSDSGSAGGVPDIAVSPNTIEDYGVCGEGTYTVVLANAGDAALTISEVSASDGWQIEALDLPMVMDVGQQRELEVSGQGTGSLQIVSDDPDEGVVTVPIETTPDLPPSLSVTSPLHGDVLDPGTLQMAAEVADTEDELGLISVRWESNVDGEIGEVSADEAGTASVTWEDPRSEGEHLVRVTATDTCGNQTSTEFGVCQQAGYTTEELDISGWQFEGSAAWDSANDWLSLTPAARDQVGAAFATSSTVRADNVQIRFLFFIGNGSGADGISLTALDVDRMTGFLGGTGCGLGYGGDASCTTGPALPGWSIEVDTYFNDGQDPTAEDHVMFTFDGDVDDPAAWAPLPEMEDTGWHEMVVDVTAPRVTVSIDGVTYIDADVGGGTFAFDAYVGFTAGTGGATNEHIIDSLSVTEFVCAEQ